MQIIVAGKDSEQALGMVLSAESADRLEAELGEAKKALADWHAREGAACGTVMLTVTVTPELYDSVTRALDGMCRDASTVAAVLQELDTTVSILNLNGKCVCQYRLGREAPHFKSSADKPWWKFW